MSVLTGRCITGVFREVRIFLVCQASKFCVNHGPLTPSVGTIMPQPTIFRSVDSVLGFLETHKSKESVAALLEVYEGKLKENRRTVAKGSVRKHPFFVLEGLDGCGKSTTSKRLASKIKAYKACTPPQSVTHLRMMFDDSKPLRIAFYALGNYIAALEVEEILQSRPVIMDRYWHSTCAFAISQAVQDFPEEVHLPLAGDEFYSWPSDLLKPDMVFFLEVNEESRLYRLRNRKYVTTQEDLLKKCEQFRNDIFSVYKNFNDPQVIFVDANGPFGVAEGHIQNHIQHFFNI